MDLSCNETMINDAENEYKIFVEYSSDEKSATSAGEQNQQPSQQTSSTGIAKLYSNACADPTFLKDRCLNNLLTSQKRYSTPSTAYFNTVQKTLTPQMRKIVAEWVIEVSLSFHLTVPLVLCLRKGSRSSRHNNATEKKLIAQTLLFPLKFSLTHPGQGFNSLLMAGHRNPPHCAK